MSSREIGKTECPKCGSSDGNALYDDGHSYCFVCNHYERDYEKLGATIKVTNDDFTQETKLDIEDYQFMTSPTRNISSQICEMFGVRSSVNVNGEVDETYYPYNGKKGLSYKIRKYPKDFRVKGGLEGVQLFGQGVWTSASRKRLVITEGEEDTLAVAEAYRQYNGNIYPVVSIPSASNLNPVADNRGWIREFEEVVLYIDSDDAGEAAVEKLAKIIGYEKVKVARGQSKDASDELTKHGFRSVMQAIWNAEQYNPQGIMTSVQLWKAMQEYDKIVSVPYPDCFDGLNKKLKGMRAGEITLWTSGTGSGKSSMLREIALHLLRTTEDKIGIISLEESPAETAKKMSAMAISRNSMDEDLTMEDLYEGFDEVFGDNRVLVLDHAGAITNGIVEQLNYMASVGCKYLFIDHITILVSEGADGLEGNAAIDKTMNDLLKVAKTHNVWIGLVSHLRKTSTGKSFEEGELPSMDDIKGSGSIKQISMDIVGFARNNAADDDAERNTIKMKVLKCRHTGLTGPAGVAHYDHDTGRIHAGQSENQEDF